MDEAEKITTDVACRITGLNQLRLNEHVAAGRFPCMPGTIRGRYRLFDHDDLLALWLFNEYLEEGQKPKSAGYLACKVAGMARDRPEAKSISIVRSMAGAVSFYYGDKMPAADELSEHTFSGLDGYKVTTYNISLLKKTIAERVQEELRSTDSV